MNHLAIADLADGRGWGSATTRRIVSLELSLDLSVRYLAYGNGNLSRSNLWLTIRDNRHNGSLDDLGADSDLSSAVTSISSVSVARHDENLYWFALSCPVTVVQIVKSPGATLVEDG